MPKKQVFEHSCDRCPRVWYAEKDSDTPSLQLQFVATNEADSVVLDFGVLCENCSTAVTNYVKGIAKVKKTKDDPEEVKSSTEG